LRNGKGRCPRLRRGEGNRWRDDGDDDDNDDDAQTSVGGGDDVMKWVKKEEERTTIEGRGHDDITIK
jgi:hypothetical protein